MSMAGGVWDMRVLGSAEEDGGLSKSDEGTVKNP
jgi:hypothetical protein